MLTGAPAVSAPAPAIPRQMAQLKVGVARKDITPPPGFATAGYGPSGSVARGQLTRLYARAVYLETDSKLLLVSLDALAVAQVFQFKIQAHLKKHDKIDLPEASIIVAATHTHHGAGNFFSARLYNKHGSAVPGYSQELHEFMLDQVLAAACDAVKDASPAEIAIGRSVMPMGQLRNRSPETFMLNPGARELMNKLDTVPVPTSAADCARLQLPEEQPGGWNLEECPRLRAVDRSLVVLEIKRTGTPVATLVFAAVHPTVLYAAAPVFSSDFVGMAMARLEATGATNYVAAFFNGAEGDITTRRIRRDLRDLWTNSKMFTKAVADARIAARALDLTGGITASIHFAKGGDQLASAAGTLRLASKPVGGVAALGGPEGDRTTMYDLGWREREVAVLAKADQGDKRPAFDSRLLPLNLTWLLVPPHIYPRTLPLGLARIGTLRIASVATELSTAAGADVRKAVGDDGMVIIGLANAFGSYTATTAEYARQDYIGASTFWGWDEAPFFAEVLSKLNNSTLKPRGGRAEHIPGDYTVLAPYRVGVKRPAPDDGLDLLLRDRDGHPVRNLPYVSWLECTDDDPFEATARRRVKIVTNAGAPVHADGLGHLVILLRAKPQHGVSEWSAIWTSRLQSPTNGQVRFQIDSGDGATHQSPLFDAATYAGNPTPVNQCLSR